MSKLTEEIYENYLNKRRDSNADNYTQRVNGGKIIRRYTQEELINKIKTDKEFAKKWDVEIVEKALTKNERMDCWFKNHKPNRDVCDSVDTSSESEQHRHFDGAGVPTKLITITYNNQTEEIYE